MVLIYKQINMFSSHIWAHQDTGFTLHVINDTELETYFINKNGKIIYNFKINL